MDYYQLQLPSNPVQEFIASKQIQLFENLKKYQFTGELYLSAKQEQWVIYFYLGRMIYATGGRHLLRRWRRQVYVFFPEKASVLMEKINSVVEQEANVCWEHDVLCLFWNQNLITRDALIKMIRSQITEILFDATQGKQINYEFKTKKFNLRNTILIDPNEVVVEGWKLWQDWQIARIADRSPDTSPKITQPEQLRLSTSTQTYNALTKLLCDKLSLRELAIQTGRDVVQLVRLLIPYIQQGLIELVDIPDLSINNRQKTSGSNKYLIITIFENHIFFEYLEPLLKETGYDYLNIRDGLEIVADVVKLKPNLLFLDWEIIKNGDNQVKLNINKLKAEVAKPVLLFSRKIGFLEEIKAKATGCDRLVYYPIVPYSFFNIVKQYLP